MAKTEFGQYLDPAKFITSSNIGSSNGVANKHRFAVQIPTLPTGIKFDGNSDLTWNAISASVPGVDMAVSQSSVNQYPRFFGTERGDQDLQITFVEASDMPIRRMFERWIALIWDPYTGLRSYPDTYKVDKVLVWSLTNSGIGVAADQFIDAFPYNIADIDYDAATYDMMTTVVKFKFRVHTLEDTNLKTVKE